MTCYKTYTLIRHDSVKGEHDIFLCVANSNTINISISKYTFIASWGFKISPLSNFVLKFPTRIQNLHSILRELTKYLL